MCLLASPRPGSRAGESGRFAATQSKRLITRSPVRRRQGVRDAADERRGELEFTSSVGSVLFPPPELTRTSPTLLRPRLGTHQSSHDHRPTSPQPSRHLWLKRWLSRPASDPQTRSTQTTTPLPLRQPRMSLCRTESTWTVKPSWTHCGEESLKNKTPYTLSVQSFLFPPSSPSPRLTP